MKKIIVVLSVLNILLSISVAYQYMVWRVDRSCRTYQGWEYYSLLPKPTCSLPNGINVTPLKELKAILENPYRFDNQTEWEWMAHY